MGNNNLFKLMTLDANMNTSGIEERFEQIAKMLFESFAIQKGEKKYPDFVIASPKNPHQRV